MTYPYFCTMADAIREKNCGCQKKKKAQTNTNGWVKEKNTAIMFTVNLLKIIQIISAYFQTQNSLMYSTETHWWWHNYSSRIRLENASVYSTFGIKNGTVRFTILYVNNLGTHKYKQCCGPGIRIRIFSARPGQKSRSRIWSRNYEFKFF
jgi:hypothetical protein